MQHQLPEAYTKAFKDADIRGLYPTQINEEMTYRIARAFVELFELEEVIVGRDMRVSSPALHDAFVRGATESGANVIDVGLIDTPAIYFASGTYGAFGVMITASHNPKDFNGLKLVKSDAVPLTNNTGLTEILSRVERNEFTDAGTRGHVEGRDIHEEYRTYVRSKVFIESQSSVPIVVDVGNGMATVLRETMQEGLPVEVHELFFTLDGTFPNRGSNPTLAKNQKPILNVLTEGVYAFGVSYDGDADRVAFFDEKGTYINSAIIGALLAKHMLTKNQHERFIYTVFTSRIYQETIQHYGGEAVRARVGHAFIKETMRERDALFGCEHSGHFYFKDNYYADSGILTYLFVLEAYIEAHKKGLAFSDMLAEFMVYHQTEEVLVKVSDKKKSLEDIPDFLKEQHPKTVEKFDGVTIVFDDYWIVVKESVTEDALKFVVESTSKELAETKRDEVHAFLRNT